MKIIRERELKNKKEKTLKCRRCGTKFKVKLNECYLSESVMGNTNWYVDCPTCDFAVCYGEQMYGDFDILKKMKENT